PVEEFSDRARSAAANRGRAARGGRCFAEYSAGRNAVRRRRVRLWEIDRRTPGAAAVATIRRAHPDRRPRRDKAVGRTGAAVPAARADGVPGPVRLAEPAPVRGGDHHGAAGELPAALRRGTARARGG